MKLAIRDVAVVVPEARAVAKAPGPGLGLSLVAPASVRYRHERTDARTELEPWNP